MPVDFAARMKDAEKAGLLGSGDYMKLKAGANKFRLLSECLPHEGEYKGTRNFKWLCQVLDRTDGRVKLFFMPHTIYKQIVGLQTSEDYAFKDVPMPYDLTITADGAVGTKEVKYTLMPSKKEIPLTAAENELFLDVKPLGDIKKALDEKNAKNKASGNHGPQDDDAPPHSDDDN